MKLKFKLVIALLSLILLIGFFIDKTINTPENKKYIEKIIIYDKNIRQKYGVIKKYSIKKVGRSSVGANADSYDHYDYYYIYIKADKRNDLIRINLYKNKQGKIIRYYIK